VWFPEVSMVVEGQARGIDTDSSTVASTVAVVRAEAAGDDAIVAEVERRVAETQTVVAVTSDRELRERVERAGAAQIRSAGWLRELLADH
jgi:8-oxo-dGTP diphosphatase